MTLSKPLDAPWLFLSFYCSECNDPNNHGQLERIYSRPFSGYCWPSRSEKKQAEKSQFVVHVFLLTQRSSIDIDSGQALVRAFSLIYVKVSWTPK